MRRFTVAALLALLPAALAAQTTISAPGSSRIYEWGSLGAGTPAYGQSFTTPADNRLDSFSFWIAEISGPIAFRGYVYAFDTLSANTIGPALFTSSTQTVSAAGRFDVFTGGLNLVTGSTYIAFFGTTGLVPANMAVAEFESSGSDEYSGGKFFFNNNETSSETGTWDTDWQGPGSDIRFEMQFNAGAQSVVPEPSTYALMFAGLLAVGAAARKRKKA